MNIKQRILCAIFTYYPMIAFAEVSDKLQSIPSALLLGGVVGCGIIFLGQFRWWINIFFIPIFFLLIAEDISLWNETAMREAIIQEKNLIYFLVLGARDLFILVSVIMGIFLGYKKSKGKVLRK